MHKCSLLSNEEYSNLRNKLGSKFLEDYINEYNAEYTQKHRDWAKKDNFRVIHFGIKLSLLLLSLALIICTVGSLMPIQFRVILEIILNVIVMITR